MTRRAGQGAVASLDEAQPRIGRSAGVVDDVEPLGQDVLEQAAHGTGDEIAMLDEDPELPSLVLQREDLTRERLELFDEVVDIDRHAAASPILRLCHGSR